MKRRVKGIRFEPGPGYWELTYRGDYAQLLARLVNLLPPDLTLFLEGTAMAPVVAEYLSARRADDPIHVRSGTIWPKAKPYHMPMTAGNVAGLVELIGSVAGPEVGDHLHAYRGETAYLIWYDAFSKAPIYLHGDVPDDKLRALCTDLECRYEPYR